MKTIEGLFQFQDIVLSKLVETDIEPLVEVTNNERLGYINSGIGEITDSYSAINNDGQQITENEPCNLMVKKIERLH